MLQTTLARLPRAAKLMRIVPGHTVRTGRPLLLTGEIPPPMPMHPPRGGAHDANSGEMLRLDRERLMLTPSLHHFGPVQGRLDRFSHHLEGVERRQPGVLHHFDRSSHQIKGDSHQIRVGMMRMEGERLVLGHGLHHLGASLQHLLTPPAGR